ncbi:hypothetical protein [Marispirochaeta aestuarii]|uniref:hypothetical protein n=1 Tax=Marispirochaeta aestuarii TaxID=1963862 RepID=UPI0029C6B5C1|nr:hypothetical protein [Marispirochaeta aestuarii]
MIDNIYFLCLGIGILIFSTWILTNGKKRVYKNKKDLPEKKKKTLIFYSLVIGFSGILVGAYCIVVALFFIFNGY